MRKKHIKVIEILDSLKQNIFAFKKQFETVAEDMNWDEESKSAVLKTQISSEIREKLKNKSRGYEETIDKIFRLKYTSKLTA